MRNYGQPLPPTDGGTGVATAAAEQARLGLGGDGCCRLSVASTTSLKLSPYGGNTLWVGGQACTIPAAGVTLSGPSVAASTFYYVYATASAGAVNALALSTTGHITGADGREYLSSGGSTPSAVTTSRLVGMVFTNTSSQFAVTATFMGLLNWFNRQTLTVASAINASTASTSYAGLNSGMTFLIWAGESIDVVLTGQGSGNTAGTVGTASNYLDGAQTGPISQFYSPVVNAPGGLAACFAGGIAEGAHTVQAVGSSNSTSYTAAFLLTQTVKVRG